MSLSHTDFREIVVSLYLREISGWVLLKNCRGRHRLLQSKAKICNVLITTDLQDLDMSRQKNIYRQMIYPECY